jgi:hypothetical protein
VHGNCVMAQINPGIYINACAHKCVCGGGGAGLETSLTFIFVFVYVCVCVCVWVCVYLPCFLQFMTTNKVQICTFRNASGKT